MNKNDHIEIQITDMGVNAEGIGRVDNYTFFVKNAIIGDVCEAVITKMNKGYGFAKAVRIIKPSEKRTEPLCENALKCGGCQLMQMKYEDQLTFKKEKVKSDLERLGEQKNFRMNNIIGMDKEFPEGCPVHFRNKVQFPVGIDKDGRAVTGFYAGRTHYIVPCSECCVSSKAADLVLRLVREFIDENNISVYDEKTGKGLVRHVLIRTGREVTVSKESETLREDKRSKETGKGSKGESCDGTKGGIMVCMVINGKTLGRENDRAFVRKITENVPASSICLNVNRKNTNVIMGDEIICLYGTDYIEDKIGELSFRISPLSFFQVNSVQTVKLYEKALEYAALTGGETVWDLYCGIGTISLFLAQKAGKVYGVEIVPAAIDNARENAKLNHISNAEFFCGPSEKVFADMVREGKAQADVVVVDPPRKGCDRALLDAIMEVAPQRIVYVSCDSATLARDVKVLSEKYKLEEATPVDMFPHTVHVETVVLLNKVQN